MGKSKKRHTQLGIDLGSRKSGTSSVCFVEESLTVRTCPPTTDADKFLDVIVEKFQPESIWMDSPLSLPGSYYDEGNDFFYRSCDRALNGMSPLFLGGLTARGMKLAHGWEARDYDVYEVYPAYVGKQLDGDRYRTDLKSFCDLLSDHTGLDIRCENWHEIDAVLSWWIGAMDREGKAKWIGDRNEGQIAVIPPEQME